MKDTKPFSESEIVFITPLLISLFISFLKLIFSVLDQTFSYLFLELDASALKSSILVFQIPQRFAKLIYLK